MKKTLVIIGVIYLLAAIIITVDVAGWLVLPVPIQRLLSEIGVALLAVGTIHFLDHFAMIREVSASIVAKSHEMFDKGLVSSTEKMTGEVGTAIANASEEIVRNVSTQTEQAFADASQILQRQVESIKVMEDVNLIGIYKSRSDAAAAIRTAMANSSEVWLMGISLNEFCREERGPFLEAWDDLVKGVVAGTKKARILLIDPYCHGAILRSYSETANSAGVSDRLEGDVRAATKLMHQIRSDLGARRSDFDVRVYRLPPTMFMCRLNTTTFAQSYHFWRARLAGCPIPVFQYRKRGNVSDGVCIHTELEHHFDFIWRHASIMLDTLEPVSDPVAPLSHFLPRPSRGTEFGAHASGMENVFIDSNRPNVRMQEEIAKSKRIWIQGITLKAFFNDSPLARSLEKRLVQPDGLDIRIILLDPDCEQAKFRAYREFRLNSGDVLTFEEFTREHYQTSTLRRDLLETIATFRRRHGGAVVKIKKYGTAPHMFVLIGDEGAFVEQYSYGKLARAVPNEELILGSDMPLIEYQRRIDPVYLRIIREMQADDSEANEKLRPQPYPLLVDHFEYTWSQAVSIP